MIHIREIDHLVLRVVDLQAMLDFYCGALGCSVERRQDEIGLVQLRAGRSIVDLVHVDGNLARSAEKRRERKPETLTTSVCEWSHSMNRASVAIWRRKESR